MPSASTSTFIRPSVSMSSLSHSMKVRSSMGGIADRHASRRAFRVKHEASDMLGEMPGKADQLMGEFHGLPDGGSGSSPIGECDLV